MISSHTGEFAALVTALCWTFGSLSFEYAGKRVGSLPTIIIRLFIALILLSIFSLITRGMILPLDATLRTWCWLSLSGFVGFALGDLLLFRALVVVGSRISMLIMSLVPPITALIGRYLLHEILSLHHILGMALTISGVGIVILERNKGQKKGILAHPVRGILLALGGAVGQAVGLVLSKHGMGSYDPFAATQIRVIAGLFGFCIIFSLIKRWHRIPPTLKNHKAMSRIFSGAFLGPFLGVSFSLLAVQHTATGIASTIMANVPVLIIPPAIILFHEKVTFREIIGAFIAVTGVAMMFL
ncbi:DMT family transporter [bacterium]|nr:DMT family transporter [bacterium]